MGLRARKEPPNSHGLIGRFNNIPRIAMRKRRADIGGEVIPEPSLVVQGSVPKTGATQSGDNARSVGKDKGKEASTRGSHENKEAHDSGRPVRAL